jgi:hypothetical protein
MRKSWEWIGHALLWAWLLMLTLAAWPSTATAVGLFGGLVLWETVRALKVSRPQAKMLGDGRPGALSKSRMEPLRDS